MKSADQFVALVSGSAMALSIGPEGAARIAARWAADAQVLGRDASELRLGWYFPMRFGGNAPGCNGIIVSKADGSVFSLGSAFPVERDLRFYDRGFQSDKVDLVVLEVVDWPGTVEALLEVGPQTIELSYESGTVWRLPRPLTEDEIRQRLEDLPAIFGDLHIYFKFEVLARAEDDGLYRFTMLKRPD